MANTQEDFYYKGLSAEEKKRNMDYIQALLDKFIEVSKLDREYIGTNDIALHDIITRIDQRKDYYKYYHSEMLAANLDIRTISQVKQIALLCFWLIKYKPFFITDVVISNNYYAEWRCTVNEIFAVYVFITFAYKHSPDKAHRKYYKSKKFKEELAYSFAERDLSKESLILLLASIVHQN